MTLEQEAVICYFYLIGKQKSIGPKGNAITIRRNADVSYIHRVLQKFTGFTKSTDTVYRYILKLDASNPIVSSLARQGIRYIENYLLPTLPNNVKRPNVRWQMDGRPLPIYVRHNGVICTVTLLLIMDDYSQYIVRAGLYPRIVPNEEGLLKKADFRKEDVALLFACAMYYAQVRPEYLYTDHGSQFMAIVELLTNLAANHEKLTVLTNTIPGKPSGRGKIERLLAEFDKLLADLPGFVKDEKDFKAIYAAQHHKDMFEFHELCSYIDKEIAKLNQQPPRANGKKTREQLWSSVETLPCPPIRRMLHLVRTIRNDDIAIAKDGFWLDKEKYEPRIESDEDMRQWFYAVARHERIPLRAIKLDEPIVRNADDKQWKAEICFNPYDPQPYWCEAVPAGTQDFSAAKYNEMHNRLRQEARDLLSTQESALLAIIESFNPADILKDVHTKEPLLPEEIAEEAPLVKPVIPTPADQLPVGAKPKQPRRRTTKRDKASPASSPAQGMDWNTMPDFDTL